MVSHEEIEAVAKRGPDKVIYSLSGATDTPTHALEEYGIESSYIYINLDGSTLGSPRSLAIVARELLGEECQGVLIRRTPGSDFNQWDYSRIAPHDELPWTQPSVMRQVFKETVLPTTDAEGVVRIAKAFVKLFEQFPAHVHPNLDTTGKEDVRIYWDPLVSQFRVLRKAIQELEEYNARNDGQDSHSP